MRQLGIRSWTALGVDYDLVPLHLELAREFVRQPLHVFQIFPELGVIRGQRHRLRQRRDEGRQERNFLYTLLAEHGLGNQGPAAARRKEVNAVWRNAFTIYAIGKQVPDF